ncbi:STAS domain-containing protein [Streptomyces sp. NPDC007971]|uniref:STAS domain-containing protein n=1 Tax=Streptomyces sp. NPDC007971 TaxID=3364799 RepID=UPI0036EF55D4
MAGEIDHHTGDALSQALDFSGMPCPRVVMDLRQVAFMDSTGINILIAAHRALTEAGG